ncbi:restriction endonuclease subunit S [Nonomuraea sp. CA-143628]|uniref:restriction endonuclease subunit S n=1 Tax=Nonomuraea sp. CA-143628 TaxID=3239997 RepID=UPI003D8EBD9C
MARSLIGELPAGWTQVELGELGELRAGATTPADSDGPVAVVKPRNLVDGRLQGDTDHISEEEAARLFRYRLTVGDIVCVRTGNLGRHALVSAEHEGWLFGTGIIRVRPNKRIDPRYLNHYLGHQLVQDWFRRNAAGAAIPSISTTMLTTLPVALAPLETQKSIGQTLAALTEKIAAHERISQATTELRDTLLPLLLSGAVGTIRGEREDE